MLFILLFLEVLMPLLLKLRFQQAALHAPLRGHFTLAVLLEVRRVENPECLERRVLCSGLWRQMRHRKGGGAAKALQDEYGAQAELNS